MKNIITILVLITASSFAQGFAAVSVQDLSIESQETIQPQSAEATVEKAEAKSQEVVNPTPLETAPVEVKPEPSFKEKWDAMTPEERSKYLDSDQPVTIEQLDVGKYQFTKEVLSRLETLSLEEKELFDKKMKFMTPREKEVYLKEFGKNKK